MSFSLAFYNLNNNVLMGTKKYSAVVFDLFGTLIPTFSSVEHDSVLENMASVLSIGSDRFAYLFDYEMRSDRELGIYPSIEDNIQVACKRLGVNPGPKEIEKAASYRYTFMEAALRPRTDALLTLKRIKSKGYPIGLISDCSPEVPLLWSETPFVQIIDKSIFSCEVGMKKPDPKIYHLLCNNLRVAPKGCLYVGDGDSAELEGALEVGMDPVLIRVAGEDKDDRDRPGANTWNGKKISKLSDIIQFI
jgi:putative hydrolase of the HAD superfamily